MSLWVNTRPKLRPFILKRDNHTCRKCGYKPPNELEEWRLHIHHIEPDGGHDPENLITLCIWCHGKTHVYNRDMNKDFS